MPALQCLIPDLEIRDETCANILSGAKCLVLCFKKKTCCTECFRLRYFTIICNINEYKRWWAKTSVLVNCRMYIMKYRYPRPWEAAKINVYTFPFPVIESIRLQNLTMSKSCKTFYLLFLYLLMPFSIMKTYPLQPLFWHFNCTILQRLTTVCKCKSL